MSAWPYPAPLDDGAARHLPGRALPDITLPSTRGEPVSPARVPGRLILYAYTWTGRPGLANPPDWDAIPGAHGSTPEAEGFRELFPEFVARGVTLLGLSTQDPAHQSEFAIRLALPFALLSDADLAVARALALPTFATGGAVYLKRLTLLARDGRIEKAFYPVHPPDTHAGEVLAWLG
ncbi:MAG: peroxiredoxin [Pseudomonadota bacterium]